MLIVVLEEKGSVNCAVNQTLFLTQQCNLCFPPFSTFTVTRHNKKIKLKKLLAERKQLPQAASYNALKICPPKVFSSRASVEQPHIQSSAVCSFLQQDARHFLLQLKLCITERGQKRSEYRHRSGRGTCALCDVTRGVEGWGMFCRTEFQLEKGEEAEGEKDGLF